MEEQQQEQPASAASAAEPQKGRILGIGGIFFKSEHPGPRRGQESVARLRSGLLRGIFSAGLKSILEILAKGNLGGEAWSAGIRETGGVHGVS